MHIDKKAHVQKSKFNQSSELKTLLNMFTY